MLTTNTTVMSLTKLVINIGRFSSKVPPPFLPRFQSKAIPIQARQALRIPEALRLPGFLDNRHMHVAKLSTLSTGRLYPQEIPLVLVSVRA